jgi:heat shock protein HslJ
MTTKLIGAALVTAILAAGCAPSRTDEVQPAGSGVALDGKSFASTQVSVAGKPRELAGKSPVTISLKNGTLGAYAGCNHLTGPVKFDGRQLRVSGLAGTLIGCSPELMKQDEWLRTFLTSGPTVSADGRKLVLTSGETEIRLSERPPAKAAGNLAGTKWHVVSLGTGQSVSSVPAGAQATVNFAADGKVTGNDGCNSFGGTITQTGGSVTFSDLVSTRRACEGSKDMLERAVMGVLDGTVSARTTETGDLRLTHPSGRSLTLQAR